MTDLSLKRGFTLIELMIVIAIIAVIAAIAIPGLLASQRASNERSASASLKTLATANADFQANDRDANRLKDYWTVDVSGLYGLVPAGATEMVKLIEISVATADFEASAVGSTPTLPAAAGGPMVLMDVTSYGILTPKAGYWYKALLLDEAGSPYTYATNGSLDAAGAANTNPWYNFTKFGFCAFPDSFSSGRNAFFLNENNTIFKRSVVGPLKLTSTAPRSATALFEDNTGLLGTNPAESWPTDSVLKLEYGKLD